MTNNLPQRLIEHYRNRGSAKSFSGRYNCYYLLYFEKTQYIDVAIKREKQLKGWTRKRKVELINHINPIGISSIMKSWNGHHQKI
jgi:putative endonuclease